MNEECEALAACTRAISSSLLCSSVGSGRCVDTCSGSGSLDVLTADGAQSADLVTAVATAAVVIVLFSVSLRTSSVRRVVLLCRVAAVGVRLILLLRLVLRLALRLALRLVLRPALRLALRLALRAFGLSDCSQGNFLACGLEDRFFVELFRGAGDADRLWRR